MIRQLWVGLALASAVQAQSIDSKLLTDSYAPRIAADSKGNLLIAEQTVAGSPGGFTVYRYDSQGQLIGTIQNVPVAGLAVDGADNIYAAGTISSGNLVLVRLGDAAWSAAINGTALNLVAMTFDPQGNPVVLASDSNTGKMQVVKIDRTSGQTLAAYQFNSSWDYPAGLAADGAGAVYLVGSTASPDFPLTGSTLGCPAGITSNGRTNCQFAFAVKLDSGLKNVLYAVFVAQGTATAVAAAADGSAYVGFTDVTTLGTSVAKLNSDGDLMATSPSFSGSLSAVKLDSAGNVLAVANGSSNAIACGPDRSNLNGPGMPDFFGVPFPPGGPSIVVTRFDGQLRILSSAVVPQHNTIASSALLPDGSLYLPVRPSITEFAALDFSGTRMLHVDMSAPASPVTCVVNGASFLAETAMAPGQLVTIFGQGLSPDRPAAPDPSQQLPTVAQGTEVDIGGIAAPLLYVSSTQINTIVPYGVQVGAQAPIVIRRNGSVVYSWAMDTVARNPTPLLQISANGLFTPDDQTIPAVPLAAAFNADGTWNSRQNPAHTGDVVTVLATGYGQLTPAVADGAPGGTPPAAVTGASIPSRSGTLQPLNVSTIANLTNSVVAVKFQVPNTGLPGVADLVFRLAQPATSQDLPVAFIYVTQ